MLLLPPGISSLSPEVTKNSTKLSQKPFPFLLGASTHGRKEEVSALSDMAATHARAYLMWSYVESHIDHANKTMTVADLRNNPQTLIYDWSNSINWTETDRRVGLFKSVGLSVVGEVFEGNTFLFFIFIFL